MNNNNKSYPSFVEPDTSDDARDKNMFYCSNCRSYFPLTEKGYYYRIQEVSEHICHNATTRSN